MCGIADVLLCTRQGELEPLKVPVAVKASGLDADVAASQLTDVLWWAPTRARARTHALALTLNAGDDTPRTALTLRRGSDRASSRAGC
jgi:hypothetical protein